MHKKPRCSAASRPAGDIAGIGVRWCLVPPDDHPIGFGRAGLGGHHLAGHQVDTHVRITSFLGAPWRIQCSAAGSPPPQTAPGPARCHPRPVSRELRYEQREGGLRAPRPVWSKDVLIVGNQPTVSSDAITLYLQEAFCPGVPLSPAEPLQAPVSTHQLLGSLLSSATSLRDSDAPVGMLQPFEVL